MRTTPTSFGGDRSSPVATASALAQAAHPGPAAVVTAVTAMLAVASRLAPAAAVTVTAAVFAGQLTIGWGNDLRDADRDALVGRGDKPLASGRLSPRLVRSVLGLAAVACVLLSAAVGWRSATVHLGLGVASGHAYNLWLKATAFSWVPYAVAFGALPAVVSLAGAAHDGPAAYVVLAAACLGVGAHLLNALPDLADDARTGVLGLPHRLGEQRSRMTAALLLGSASLLSILGTQRPVQTPSVVALVGAAVLVLCTLRGRGRAPFVAAMLLALLDVLLLAAATR